MGLTPGLNFRGELDGVCVGIALVQIEELILLQDTQEYGSPVFFHNSVMGVDAASRRERDLLNIFPFLGMTISFDETEFCSITFRKRWVN